MTRGGDNRQHADINKVLVIFEFLDCLINNFKFIYRPRETGTSDKLRPVNCDPESSGSRSQTVWCNRNGGNGQEKIWKRAENLRIRVEKSGNWSTNVESARKKKKLAEKLWKRTERYCGNEQKDIVETDRKILWKRTERYCGNGQKNSGIGPKFK